MNNNLQQNNQSIYSVSSIVFGSFFGGPLVTLFMLSRNALVLGNRNEVLRIFMIAGSAVLTFYFVVYLFGNFNPLMFWLHDHIWSVFYDNDGRIGNYDPRRYWWLALISYAMVYSVLVWLLLNRGVIDNFLKNGGQRKSTFNVVIVSCAVSLVIFCFVRWLSQNLIYAA